MLIEPVVHRFVSRHIIEPHIPISDKLGGFVKREFEKADWKYLITTVGLTVTGSIMSAYFTPVIGITISLIFGCLSILYGKYAFTRYKETQSLNDG